MSRVSQRWWRRVKRKDWRRVRPREVYERKRRKCGNVRWETQFEVQGQWWSILGMHLGGVGVSDLLGGGLDVCKDSTS